LAGFFGSSLRQTLHIVVPLANCPGGAPLTLRATATWGKVSTRRETNPSGIVGIRL